MKPVFVSDRLDFSADHFLMRKVFREEKRRKELKNVQIIHSREEMGDQIMFTHINDSFIECTMNILYFKKSVCDTRAIKIHSLQIQWIREQAQHTKTKYPQ